jgi:hypothetical protein
VRGRHGRWALLALAVAAAVGAGVWWWARGDGVAAVWIADPEQHWKGGGFVEMVPPIRLPSDPTGNDRIAVYLSLPPAIRVEASGRPGDATLRFPPGTIADRVESLGFVGGDGIRRWTVIDVRGTTFLDGGRERFHVLRPSRDTPLCPLQGYEWTRGDGAAARTATGLLVEQLRRHEPRADRGRFRRQNGCASCHQPDRPASSSADRRGPHRATDASGLFVPVSVLQDGAPIEAHRPRDMNADDPFVQVRCGLDPAPLRRFRDGARRFTCDDGSVPRATRDIRAGLAAGDPYTRAVCASRRALFEHMDASARDLFVAAFRACGLAR